MASFKIHTKPLKNESENLDKEVKKLSKYVGEINKIAGDISLGDSTASVKKTITNVAEDINDESKKLALLCSKLDEIVTLYETSEKRIVGADKDAAKIGEPEGAQDSGDSAEGDSPEDEELKELLMTILSFIPGVNIVVDAIQLYEDFKKAMADGKLSASEIAGLIMDVGFLALDCFAFASLVKNVAKSIKAAKVASTAAKKAAKTAAARKATAEAAAKKATKNTGKKAAQKAAKAARRAENAAQRAEAAKKAAKAAKVKAAKKVATETAKDTAGNVVDAYVPTATNGNIPNSIKEEARDQMIG